MAVNLLFTFLIGQAFLSMLCTMQYGVFIFFSGWVVIATLFAYFFIPETKVCRTRLHCLLRCPHAADLRLLRAPGSGGRALSDSAEV